VPNNSTSIAFDKQVDLLGTLGDRIQHLLKQQGLSVSHLARQLGLSRQSCYKWLRNNQISDKNLYRVAELLGVSPQWLKFGVADSSGCNPGCDGKCFINCGLKQRFLEEMQRRELVWELCLERKTLTWMGGSQRQYGLAPEVMPATVAELVACISVDYRNIFLQSVRRVILSGELSSTLLPLRLEPEAEPVWIKNSLHANCAGQTVLGSFSGAQITAPAAEPAETISP